MLRYVLAAAVLVSPAAAQSSFLMEAQSVPQTSCVLMADGHSHDHLSANAPSAAEIDAIVERWMAETSPTSEVVVTQGPSATFIVTYTGFDAFPDAQTAYQSAVDIWAAHISSVVPIRVTAQFTPLGPNVLGSAGPFLIRNFAGAPRTNVWYPYGIADAIAGADLVAGANDIQSRFSSNFTNWYFGTDGNPAPSQFDFRSVVLHELGHGLGFSGSARWDDGTSAGRCDGVAGNGCWGYNGSTFGGSPTIFDIFAEDAAGLPLLDVATYPNPSTALGALVRSSNVWIDTPLLIQQGGGRGRLWTPTSWQQGSSYSHWNEGVYPAGSINSPMTPQIAPGESFDSPGPLTCAFFADMGWPMGPACQAIVADESGPATLAATVRVVGPNPFADATRLAVTLDAPQAVEAALYDVTGRRVRTLFAGTAPAGTLTLDVRAAGLASGVYSVRATAGTAVSTVRVVVAR